ncbi:hypothetical protein R6L23_09005 [Streptomyces sp. SR27]|uniref:hypothetical protein n=1 Tax=Streptomyces sp. SR27 TaxID=3076630 RepID=UPI00295BC735|nr:hypothetical protein [Streptomyces sp. SR27]MDV9188355.1 hypothetical protein [Streptomyces sp. SR27]
MTPPICAALVGRAVDSWSTRGRLVEFLAPTVSSSRIGAAQNARSMAIGPVGAQLGEPPARQPGGIDRSPW